jgi:hypothetical protein
MAARGFALKANQIRSVKVNLKLGAPAPSFDGPSADFLGKAEGGYALSNRGGSAGASN